MTEKGAIRLARKHVSDNPATEESARLCLSDAISCYDSGDYEASRRRALKSLAYSVGTGHRDYLKASL